MRDDAERYGKKGVCHNVGSGPEWLIMAGVTVKSSFGVKKEGGRGEGAGVKKT